MASYLNCRLRNELWSITWITNPNVFSHTFETNVFGSFWNFKQFDFYLLIFLYTVNNFPKNLKHLRTKKGLNQLDMESWLGIGRSTWSNYENGVTDPSIDDIVNFAKFFNVTLDELIVRDLGKTEPLSKKSSRNKKLRKLPRKKIVHATNGTISYAADTELEYVVNELKKLREEIDFMKEFKKRKKQ